MKRDIQALIQEMTLEEKAGLCSGLDFWHLKGIERLNIPSIMVTDGPHGLRKQGEGADHLGLYDSVKSTCFPSAAGVASSWNRTLIEEMGQALGKECQAEDVAVLLGPGANIKRSPLCGRNFEYFSEDPYLSSQMAAHHIKGVQSEGVGTSLKHFAANNQEHRRMSVDAVIDERTLREIYLASFEAAVKQSAPWTVMCAYNKVNGEYAGESKKLLTDVLRGEWGFDGFVVSDWGAVNERVAGLEAGLDLEMPSSSGVGDRKIVEAVQNGTLDENTLDTAVERVLTIISKAVDNKKEDASYDKAAHHALARKVAQESMVLLKNENSLLPLAPSGTIAVIGELAEKPRFQGGGSSHINPTSLENALDEIKKKAPDAAIVYEQGYRLADDESDASLLESAKQIAASADVAVVFAGLPDRYESEGYDRAHLELPVNHQELIQAVASVQPNIVVVLSNGAPVEMPWLDGVNSLLEAYLGGQASGGAIADLLFGDANPSGKLAETFPKQLRHNPSYLNFPGEGDRVEYREGLFVGYRYYDAKGIEPLFPFGFGLSYTTFDYTKLSVSQTALTDQETVDVSVTVKNTGNRAGAEVVQVYVRDVTSSVIRPDKELKGFEKVFLQPGEEKTVTVTLDSRAFAYYHTALGDWHVESGEFHVLAGSSSADIKQSVQLTVTGTVKVAKPVHRNSLLGDLLEDELYGPVVQDVLAKANEGSVFAAMAEDDEAGDMFNAMMKYMPLRALAGFNPDNFTEDMLHELIEQLNRMEREKVSL